MGLQNFSTCETENVLMEQLTHFPSSHPALLDCIFGSVSGVVIY